MRSTVWRWSAAAFAVAALGVALLLGIEAGRGAQAEDDQSARRAAETFVFPADTPAAATTADALALVARRAGIKVAAPATECRGDSVVHLARRSAHEVLVTASKSLGGQLVYSGQWAVIRRDPRAFRQEQEALLLHMSPVDLRAWEFADSLTDEQIGKMARDGFIHPGSLTPQQRELLLQAYSLLEVGPNDKGKTMWDLGSDSRLEVEPYAVIRMTTPTGKVDHWPVFGAMHGSRREEWERGVWSGPHE